MFNFNRSCPRGAKSAATLNSSISPTMFVIMAPLLVLMLLLFVAPPARAQVLYGSLTGNVTDQKDAAVPGAKVELTNDNTGDTRTVTTDDRGGYTISDLQVGVYKIVISLASFKTMLKEDVRIQANKVYRFDSQLEVGEVKETVVVTAS